MEATFDDAPSWRSRLSDIRVLLQLRRYSLWEVAQARLAAVQLSTKVCKEQMRRVLSIEERGQHVSATARTFVARMKAQWAVEPHPTRPLFVPLLTGGSGFYAVSNINLAKWILDEPETFDRASVLESFATAFGLQSVFTTKDRTLRRDLKRYFTKRTNGLSADQLGALMKVLTRRTDAMLARLGDGAEIQFIPIVEGMVLEAYAEAFFGIELFPEGEECAALIKNIWQLKSLRHNIPAVLLTPFTHLRMIRSQSRLFEIIAAAQDRVAQSKSTAAGEMAEIYRMNGYAPGNLLNALIPLYEALARGIIYALFELGNSPTVQAELRQEIMANRERDLDYCRSTETLLHRIWQETLRLWPPTPNQTRQTTVGDNPLLPKGSKVVVIWNLFHRDPEVWGADAEGFNPDRWLRPTTAQLLNYNPFGSGAQHCVASDYAGFGGRVILKEILRSWSIHPSAAVPKAAVASDRAYSRGPDPRASFLKFCRLEARHS